MKVLVIGGTRYFGKIVVRILLGRGDEVTLFTRGRSQPAFWKQVRHIGGDRTDQADFGAKLRGGEFDAVIDNVAYKREDVESAIRALRGRIGKYVFTSTVSVYGGPGHAAQSRTSATAGEPAHLFEAVPLDDCCPIREDDLDLSRFDYSYPDGIQEYAVGKRHCEKLLEESPDFPSVRIRVPPVMGPEDPTNRIWFYIQRIRDGGPIILPNGGWNVFRNMYSADVAKAVVAAVDRGVAGNAYNIAQDEIMTLRRLIQAIGRAAGGKGQTVDIPTEILEGAGFPYHDWGYDPFSRPPCYLMSIEKAKAHLGMTSTPQDDWLRTTVEWYRGTYAGGDSAHYNLREREVAFARDYATEFADFARRRLA